MQSGFGIDNETKLVTAEPAAMKEYFKAHPKAKEFEFKTLMFYDSLHELFTGKVASGKYAMVFTPSPAKNFPTAAIGVKRASVDVFGTASEESDSSDDEGNRVELGPQHFKKQEPKPVVANGDAKPASREKPLKEKPIQSVTRLLGNIVANQKEIGRAHV